MLKVEQGFLPVLVITINCIVGANLIFRNIGSGYRIIGIIDSKILKVVEKKVQEGKEWADRTVSGAKADARAKVEKNEAELKDPVRQGLIVDGVKAEKVIVLTLLIFKYGSSLHSDMMIYYSS
jgi:hypothetical protein